MRLPDNSIGISDILGHRDCPARMAFGMQRWSETGEAPEATNENNAYGSAIHVAANAVETEQVTNDEAISRAWAEYGRWLDPEDRAMMDEDLDCFRRRTPLGVRLIAAETDMRVPLFQRDGETYYFRFRLDQLYQLINSPGTFIHRDLKSSKWRKSDAEVHNDPQMWAYNFGIHEVWPECQTLHQLYDQLRYGVVPTSKNAQQREQMRAWLIECVNAILDDEKLPPKLNEWCRFCPMLVTCPEPRRATRFWKGRLAVTAPMVKEGRTTKLEFDDERAVVEELLAELPSMTQTRKHIEKIEELLKGVIEQMPSEERRALGWEMRERKATSLAPDAMRMLHEAGVPIYELASLSKTAMENYYGKPKKGEPVPPELELFRDLTTTSVSATFPVALDDE